MVKNKNHYLISKGENKIENHLKELLMHYGFNVKMEDIKDSKKIFILN